MKQEKVHAFAADELVLPPTLKPAMKTTNQIVKSITGKNKPLETLFI